jgi:glycosyltransferase involved in cell wall biosynthesis
MNMLIINHRDPRHPYAGGAEELLLQIAKRLVKRGHHITWLSERPPQTPSTEEIDGIKIIRKGGFITLHIYSLQYISKNVKKYDIIIDSIGHVFPFLSNILTKKSIAIVYHVNGPVLFRTTIVPVALTGIIAEALTPKIYKLIITISPSTKERLLKLGAKQVYVVPPAVDHQVYKPGSISPTPLVVWINRFVPYKNPQDAIKIFAEVKKEVPEARFVMIGGGPLLERTKNLAAKVAPFIEFTGRVSTETKVRLLQEAWACLYTSDVEGFGLGILEGAACETPCVAYNVPGVRDAIIHRKTGLLVPHRDTNAAAAALTEILRNDQLRKSLAQAARRYANQFNWDKSAEKLENILSTLITK